MSCGCATPNVVLESPSPILSQDKVQLKKDGKPINPVTLVQAVYEADSGERLDIAIGRNNHLGIPYKKNFKETMLQIPPAYRRYGMVVTVTTNEDKLRHLVYTGCNTSDTLFSDENNWGDFAKISDEDILAIIDRLGALTDTYCQRGEWVDDNTIRIYRNDNTHFDITKVIPPEITFQVTPSNISGFDSVDASFTIKATEGSDTVEPTILLDGQPYVSGTTVNYTESKRVVIKVSYKNKVQEFPFNINITKTTYTLEASVSPTTINKGDKATITARVVSNNPNADLTGFAITVDNSPIGNGEVTPTNTKDYVVKATKSGITVLNSPKTLRVNVIQPTTKYKVYHGNRTITEEEYNQGLTEASYVRREDLTGFTEYNEGTNPIIVEFGEFLDDFGFWGMAVDKRLLPTINKVEVEFIGQFFEQSSNDYIVRDMEIDGVMYNCIKDITVNDIQKIKFRIS